MTDFSPLTDDDNSVRDINGFAPLESEGELQVSSMFEFLLADFIKGCKFKPSWFSILIPFSLSSVAAFRIASASHQEDGDDG